MIEILALQVRGDVDQAVAVLGRALTLAEPEGYVRTFIGEGAPMAALLRGAASRGTAPRYVDKLLAAYEAEQKGKAGQPEARAVVAPGGAQALVEPLSEREVEVLGLLSQGLTNREIAERLTVTVGTVKTHVNHVYGKLGVHSWVQAVLRGRELGLVEG